MIGVAPRPVHRLGEAEPLLPVAPALGERPRARLKVSSHASARRAGSHVRSARVPDSRSSRFHGPPQQLGRPAKSPMASYACPRRGFASACKALSPSAVRARGPAGRLRWRRRRSPVSLSTCGHPGQHPSQPGPSRRALGPGPRPRATGPGRRPSRPDGCSARAQGEPEIDGQLALVSPSPADAGGPERLLEVRHRLAERRAVVGPGPGLPAVGHGLVPHLAPQGMVRQAFDLLGHPVPGERLQGLDNAGMQRPPPLLQQLSVGHLVGQGVLEGVLRARGTGASRRGTRPPAGARGHGAARPRAARQWPAAAARAPRCR